MAKRLTDNILVFDLETYSDMYFNQFGETKAYIHKAIDLHENIDITEVSDDEFLNKILGLNDLSRKAKGWTKKGRREDKKLTYYWERIIIGHNNSHFDNHFLLKGLFKLKKENKVDLNFWMTKKNELLEIIITYPYLSGFREIKITDNYKRFPVKLAKIGEAIGLNKLEITENERVNLPLAFVKESNKAITFGDKIIETSFFKPEEIRNGYDIKDIFENVSDYQKFRNGRDITYLERDVEILKRHILKLNELNVTIKDKEINVLKLYLKHATVAGMAYDLWRKTMDYDELANYDNYPHFNKMKLNENEGVHYNLDKWLVAKLAYRGGLTTNNKKYQMVVIGLPQIWENFKIKKSYNNFIKGEIWVYDVNGLYSSVMYNNKMPYGRIYWGDNKEATYKIYDVFIHRANIKKNMIPFIEKTKSDFNFISGHLNEIYEGKEYNDWMKGSEGKIYPPKLYKTHKMMDSVTFNDFEKYYDGVWLKKVVISVKEKETPFKDFIDIFSNLKENATSESDRLFAKLMLNSLYGKFGQKLSFDKIAISDKWLPQFKKTDNCIWYDMGDGRKSVVVKNGEFYYYKKGIDDNDIKNGKYIPLAVKITSLARSVLLDAIHKNFDKFVYCDTDSVHLLGEAKGIWLDNKKTGAWKFEGKSELSLYRRPKHYVNLVDCQIKLKGGGFDVSMINESSYLNWNKFMKMYLNLKEFKVLNGKKMSRIVKGGVLISNIDYDFTTPKGL